MTNMSQYPLMKRPPFPPENCSADCYKQVTAMNNGLILGFLIQPIVLFV